MCKVISRCSQNWIYPKSHPKGKPIFFENGRRVSLEHGFQMVLKGAFGDAQHLKTWFYENGWKDMSNIEWKPK